MSTNTELTLRMSDIPAFKNAELLNLSLDVALKAQEVHGVVSKYSNTLAKSLREIKTRELWKDDGFKGVGDFAKQTFGIAPATTSSLIKTAERFTLEDGTVGFEGLEGQSAHNLYILTPYSDEQLRAAVIACEISGNSSQRELKEWAATHPVEVQLTEVEPAYDTGDPTANPDDKAPATMPTPKVENTYSVSVRYGATVVPPVDMVRSEIDAYIAEHYAGNDYTTQELKPIKLTDGQSIRRRVYVIDDGRDVAGVVMAYYRLKAVPKSTPKAKTVSFTDMSDDELMAELERRRAARSADSKKSAKAAARIAAVDAAK